MTSQETLNPQMTSQETLNPRVTPADDAQGILCVGLCCLDIISICGSFPEEDTDQRSLEYYWQRGGNASNSSSVLALLGARSEFMGTLVRSQEYGFLAADFATTGVCTDSCVTYDEGEYRCPVAIVVINKQNGSRTIMAALNHLAEISFIDFDTRVELSKYRWIHFEGRPMVDAICKMMLKIELYNENVADEHKITVSLEVEKPKRTTLLVLMKHADVVFISKEFCVAAGYKNKEDAVDGMMEHCKQGATLICAWGEDGAAARSGSHDLVTSSIFPPETVRDTLGAGDTFNAATIFALTRGKGLQDAITFGCTVAGAKCGMRGNKGLKGLEALL